MDKSQSHTQTESKYLYVATMNIELGAKFGMTGQIISLIRAAESEGGLEIHKVELGNREQIINVINSVSIEDDYCFLTEKEHNFIFSFINNGYAVGYYIENDMICPSELFDDYDGERFVTVYADREKAEDNLKDGDKIRTITATRITSDKIITQIF